MFFLNNFVFKEGTANHQHLGSDKGEEKADAEDPQEWENNQAASGRVLQWQEISWKPA